MTDARTHQPAVCCRTHAMVPDAEADTLRSRVAALEGALELLLYGAERVRVTFNDALPLEPSPEVRNLRAAVGVLAVRAESSRAALAAAPIPDPSPSAALVEALVRDLHRLGYTSPDTKARVQAIAAAARAEGLDGLEEPAGHPYEEGRNGKCAVCGERPDPEPWHPTAARARRPGGEAVGGEG